MSPVESQWCPESPVKPSQDREQLIGCFSGQWEHLGLRPLLITGVCRDILKHHFAQEKNIEAPVLQNAVWQESLGSGILIESIYRWRGDLVELRPAVIIKRNAYRNLRLVRSDVSGVDERGDRNFVTAWVGSHTLFCIHGTGASTEILATEVQRLFTGFALEILETFNFLKFQVTDVGELSEVEEATENFVVPVTIGWAYQETWKISSQTHRLSTVEFKLNFDG